MLLSQFVFSAGVVIAGLSATGLGRIEGVVTNGSAENARLAGVEVILRAGEADSLLPVAATVTDEEGRFVFDDAPIEPGLVYLPGASRGGVHYPGPRIQLRPAAPFAHATLTVYDAVSSPSPLVAEEHQIEVVVETGAIQVTETLLVSNPTTAAYVGEAVGDRPPLTLRLTIPSGFERVTFYDEFHGRRFFVAGGQVATDLPWPPGTRRLKYTYRLPVEENRKVFQRILDLPCSRMTAVVRGADPEDVSSNLLRSTTSPTRAVAFDSAGAPLPAGHRVELRFGGLPIPWTAYGRWGAVALLAILMLTTAASWRLRARAKPKTEGATESRAPLTDRSPTHGKRREKRGAKRNAA
jgi:hypothetical protein